MMKAMNYADYIVSYCIDTGRPISNRHMMFILYALQGYYMKRYGRKLFPEHFEAWWFAPTLRSVYTKYCGYGASEIVFSSSSVMIDEDVKQFIDPIIKEMSTMDIWDLYDFARIKDGAWEKTYRNGEGKYYAIEQEDILSEFRDIRSTLQCDVVDLAEYIKWMCLQEHFPIAHLCLHRILYVLQGCRLAKTNTALFDDDFQVWACGAIIPRVYDKNSLHGGFRIITAEKPKNKIPVDIQLQINPIIRKIRSMDHYGLIVNTHPKGGAWEQIYKSDGLYSTIPSSLIRTEFQKHTPIDYLKESIV